MNVSWISVLLVRSEYNLKVQLAILDTLETERVSEDPSAFALTIGRIDLPYTEMKKL